MQQQILFVAATHRPSCLQAYKVVHRRGVKV